MKDVRRLLSAFGLLLVTIFTLFVCATQPQKVGIPTKPPERILFIGNSLTAGFGSMLQTLAASAHPPKRIAADESISLGTVLEGLWTEAGSRHDQILGGKYDMIIIQPTLSQTGTVYGGIVADTESKLYQYARMFADEITQAGARPVLLMHWQFNEPNAMTIDNIARICTAFAAERGIKVAPAGIAWQRAQQSRPNLVLHSDSVHPNVFGSYLSACVLYATVFNKTPLGLSFSEWPPITAEQAAFLQHIAWETVQSYTKSDEAE
jgi:hypothetical protein